MPSPARHAGVLRPTPVLPGVDARSREAHSATAISTACTASSRWAVHSARSLPVTPTKPRRGQKPRSDRETLSPGSASSTTWSSHGGSNPRLTPIEVTATVSAGCHRGRGTGSRPPAHGCARRGGAGRPRRRRGRLGGRRAARRGVHGHRRSGHRFPEGARGASRPRHRRARRARQGTRVRAKPPAAVVVPGPAPVGPGPGREPGLGAAPGHHADEPSPRASNRSTRASCGSACSAGPPRRPWST
jgi:hypothetical protein